jgi:hypothetical protein
LLHLSARLKFDAVSFGFSNRVWNGVIPVKLFYGAHALGKRAITVHLPDGLRR